MENKSNVLACISYVPILFFLPIVQKSEDEVAKNSSTQAFTLLVILIVASIVAMILPILGILVWLVQVAVGVCGIIGMVKAYKNVAYKLPLVGDLDLLGKIMKK